MRGKLWIFERCCCRRQGKEKKAEAQACQVLDKKYKLWAFVHGLSKIDVDERAHIANPVNVQLICVRLVITAALLESEGTVRLTISLIRDGCPVDAFYDPLGMSAGGSSNQL